MLIGHYTRHQISVALQLDERNHNFARSCKTKLNNLGYLYTYSSKGVDIQPSPRSALDEIKEILILVMNVNSTTNFRSFSYYMYALEVEPNFSNAPYKEKVLVLQNSYDVRVSEKELATWTNILQKNNLVARDEISSVYWCTFAEKTRAPATNSAALDKYIKRRTEIFNYYNEAVKKAKGGSIINLPPNSTRKNALDYSPALPIPPPASLSPTLVYFAGFGEERFIKANSHYKAGIWRITLELLWLEFQCCYYKTKNIVVNNSHPYTCELYELLYKLNEEE